MQEFQTLTDVLRLAIGMEVMANQLYVELARRSTNSGMKTVFLNLADEELIHKSRLENIQDGIAETLGDIEFSETEILAYTRAFYLPEEMNYKDAVELAMRKEKDSFSLYTLLADSVEEPDVREIFDYLAGQERDHEMTYKEEYERICLSEN